MLAYESEAVVEATLRGERTLGVRLCRWFDAGGRWLGSDTQGFLATGESYSILAMRGSQFPRPSFDLDYLRRLMNMLQDLRTNLDARLRVMDRNLPAFNIPVHAGFAGALQHASISGPLYAALNALADGSLWLTGHSLGGALATLIAFAFPEKVAGVYIFGALPAGGTAFANAYAASPLAERTFRYVHGLDPAPRIFEPLGPLGNRYAHVGRNVLLPSATKGLVGDAISQLAVGLMRVNPLDHAPIFYCNETWNSMI